jgi:hypothetical protein
VAGRPDYIPDQLGHIRNDGDAPALITAATVTGPHRGEFDLRLLVDRQPWLRPDWAGAEAAGRAFRLDAPRRYPILLWPGERILVGGSFRPVVEGMRWASVAFETNDRSRAMASIDVVGQSGPNRAFGYLVVPWRLWRVRVGTEVSVPSIVTSDGPTPLVVTAIRIEDAGSGFSITGSGARWVAPRGGTQIDPGNTHYFSITFRPNRPGSVATRIIAETNAGELTGALQGEGIPA